MLCTPFLLSEIAKVTFVSSVTSLADFLIQERRKAARSG